MPKRSVEYATALALMGQTVVVTKWLRRRKLITGECRWGVHDYMPAPRTGWVVGVRWKQNGRISYYSEEPAEFKQEDNVPCLAVVFWPTEAPVFVPFDGYRVTVQGDAAPVPYCAMYKWSERDRTQQREYAAEMQRDNKGRFIKGNS